MLRRGLARLSRRLAQACADATGAGTAASRTLHTSQAAPASSSAGSSSGGSSSSSVLGFPAWLSSGSLRVATPLTQPLPGVAADSGFRAPREQPPTEVTTLPNGVRIVSEASMVRAWCVLSVQQVSRVCHSQVRVWR
jgi:hypothetical protein